MKNEKIDPSIELEIINGIAEAYRLGKEPCLVYDRVSAAYQAEATSLEFQEVNAERYARSKGLYVCHNFSVVESAKAPGRLAFNIMIDLALKHSIKNLIYKSTDRMCRNYQDWLRIQDLVTNKDFKIHLYQSYRVITKDSPYTDKFILDVEVAAARQLSEKLSHDIKAVHKFKAEMGIAPGRPIGYKYDKLKRCHNIDPNRENSLRYIFDEFDTGKYSLRQFLEHINKLGHKSPNGYKWRLGYLHALLTSPMYHGEFYYYGKLYKGTHPAYYEKSRWENRLKRLQDGFAGVRKREEEFQFAKFLKCGECGHILTGEKKKNKHYYYGHQCNHEKRRVYRLQSEIEAMVDSEVRRVCFTDDFAEWIKELFRDTVAEKKRDKSAELLRITRAIIEIEKKKERILEAFADGSTFIDDLKRKVEEYNEQIKKCEQERNRLNADHDKIVMKVAEIVDQIRKLPTIYNEADSLDKVRILRAFARGITVHKNSVEILWEEPFSFIMRKDLLELDTVRKRPVMRARQDSNLRPTA